MASGYWWVGSVSWVPGSDPYDHPDRHRRVPSVDAVRDQVTRRDRRRHEIRAGIRAATPLAFAALPFGVVYGVAVVESGTSVGVGIAASWIVLAGASQLSILELLDAGASWLVVVATALVINARFALYSTALAPSFAEFPRRWRYTLPYLFTDQASALAMAHFPTVADPDRRRWWLAGAGLFFAGAWWVGTLLGVAFGGVLPASWPVEFAVPAMFVALVAPTLVNRPAVVTAGVAGVVAVLGSDLPNGSGVIVAALCGLAAGTAVQWRQAS